MSTVVYQPCSVVACSVLCLEGNYPCSCSYLGLKIRPEWSDHKQTALGTCAPTWHSHASPVTTCDRISLPLLYVPINTDISCLPAGGSKTRLADRKNKEEETQYTAVQGVWSIWCMSLWTLLTSQTPWTEPAQTLWETTGDEENNKSRSWEGISRKYIIHRIQHHIFSLLWSNFPNRIIEELKCQKKKIVW